MVKKNHPVSPSSVSSNSNDDNNSYILTGIIVAIVLGTIVGGWLPGFAVKFSILGEAFLNSLMMIVVPLVMLSMIVGITGLGDIRTLQTDFKKV